MPGHDPSAPLQATARLPAPGRLAALGPVLCLHRAWSGGQLGGWARAVRAESAVEMDSDGVYEFLCFQDDAGRCCWQLYLLPETDFFAWEWLASRLPARVPRPRPRDVAARLWSQLACGLRGEHWHAGAVRLHTLHVGPGTGVPVLAASPADLSAPGRTTARRILRARGIDARELGGGCCCEQAARGAVQEVPATEWQDTHPLIRPWPGETT